MCYANHCRLLKSIPDKVKLLRNDKRKNYFLADIIGAVAVLRSLLEKRDFLPLEQ